MREYNVIEAKVTAREEYSKRDTLFFSDRLDLTDRYKNWAIDNENNYNVFNFITFLQSHNLLDIKKTLEFLKKGK